MKFDLTIIVVISSVLIFSSIAFDLDLHPSYYPDDTEPGIHWAPEAFLICGAFGLDGRVISPMCQFISKGNWTTNDGRPMPFGFQYTPLALCDLSFDSQTCSTVFQMTESESQEISAGFGIGGFKLGGGYKDSSSQKEISTHDVSVTRIRSKCIFSNVNLVLSKGSMPPMNSEMRRSFLALPFPLNTKSLADKKKWLQWLVNKLFVSVGCPVGGGLEQDYFIQNDFFSKWTKEDSNWNAKISFAGALFGGDAGGGQSYNKEEYQEWQNKMSAFRVNNRGCDPPEDLGVNKSIYPPWIKSCEANPSKRVGMDCLWLPIYEFLDFFNDSEVSKRLDTAKSIALEILQSPGCTDRRASNYNESAFVPDGTCVSDVYYASTATFPPQFKKYIGRMYENCSNPGDVSDLFLFKGKNPATNGSVAFYSYLFGTGELQSSSVVGVVHSGVASLEVRQSVYREGLCVTPPDCSAILPTATLTDQSDGSYLGGCTADPTTLKCSLPIPNLTPGSSVKLQLTMPAGCNGSLAFAYLEEVL